jgi:hypothetical protein
MVIGTFKNGICDLGFNCRVTLPTVLRGSQMEVDSVQSASRETFHFEYMSSRSSWISSFNRTACRPSGLLEFFDDCLFPGVNNPV